MRFVAALLAIGLPLDAKMLNVGVPSFEMSTLTSPKVGLVGLIQAAVAGSDSHSATEAQWMLLLIR